jgi:hypothetical protein
LVILRADDGFMARQHFRRRLWVGEALEPALFERVERDDLDPTFPRIAELMQHARATRPDVLSEEQDAVSSLEILQMHGAHRHADALRQGDRGALVAHVGTVGKIVGAIHAS